MRVIEKKYVDKELVCKGCSSKIEISDILNSAVMSEKNLQLDSDNHDIMLFNINYVCKECSEENTFGSYFALDMLTQED